MSKATFATAINCMDGRVQLPVIHWMKENYQVEYIDMITEAGPNHFILNGTEEGLESMKSKVKISTEKHGSEVVAVVGHHDCAGNPIDKNEKVAQTKKSLEIIRSWEPSVTVIGLYVNENWEVEVISQ
ncbi:carbonic anhydrase [Halobacillus mangrovi]|uniref:carbonic anhydrase n=1 Tax=Halobacillus mangrovi TaxID=402384 RepID=UPI003D98A406